MSSTAWSEHSWFHLYHYSLSPNTIVIIIEDYCARYRKINGLLLYHNKPEQQRPRKERWLWRIIWEQCWKTILWRIRLCWHMSVMKEIRQRSWKEIRMHCWMCLPGFLGKRIYARKSWGRSTSISAVKMYDTEICRHKWKSGNGVAEAMPFLRANNSCE